MKSAEAGARPTLDKLLQDKSYVVASRLFQQLSLEGVNEVHREIQETIKIKNLELRKLFFSKYLELINCSQLIDDLSGFAAKVDGTAADIGRNAQAYLEKPIELTERKDTIGVVERLIRRGRYFDAMVMCVRHPEQHPTASQKESQILEILEVDLVEKVMARLQGHLEPTELEQVVRTLSAFIYFAARKYIVEGANYEAQYNSSVALLMKAVRTGQEPISLSESLATALKVAFYLVATSIRRTSSIRDISEFTADLEHVLQLSESELRRLHKQLGYDWEVQQQVGELTVELRSEQLNCFRELHRSLASTMITTSPNKRVAFNHVLYEDILKDNQLLDRLERLERLLGGPTSFRSILAQLWNDFYQQIVEIFINCLDLSAVLKSLLKGTANNEELPCEIKRHLSDRGPSQLFETVKKHSAKLIFEFEQLQEVLIKGATSSSQQMYNHLLHRLNGWLNRTIQGIQQVLNSTTHKQRMMLLVATRLLVTLVNERMATLNSIDNQGQLKKLVEQLDKSVDGLVDSQLELILQEDNKTADKILEQKMALLENRFMEYVPLAKTESDQLLLRRLVLRMLELMERTLQGREVEKLRYTRRCLFGTPEEVSTYSCLFNFLPKHLFGLPYKPERFNIQVLEDLLRQEKAQKRSFAKRESKPTTGADRKELFDIGETGNDMLKFASKFSNSIVGLIKGMST